MQKNENNSRDYKGTTRSRCIVIGCKNITKIPRGQYECRFFRGWFQQSCKTFLMLDTHKLVKFAKDAFVSTKLANGWVEIWVNSRLMSPITHIVNVVGNLGFNSLRVMEYGMAATLLTKYLSLVVQMV